MKYKNRYIRAKNHRFNELLKNYRAGKYDDRAFPFIAFYNFRILHPCLNFSIASDQIFVQYRSPNI